MRIAICEDKREDADKLCALVRRYIADNRLEADIDCFVSGEAFLESFRPGAYQILLLDIMMGGISGMDVAAKVRETDQEVAIVLITVSREYAIDSYMVNAAFYILKPVNRESLNLAMERCRHLIEKNAVSIEIRESRRDVRVRLRDIRHLETQRNYCVIHTDRDKIRTRALLSSLEEELGGLPFLRCHRSYIVNLQWVSDMTKTHFVLKTGVIIPISRAYYTSAVQSFRQYLISHARVEPDDEDHCPTI